MIKKYFALVVLLGGITLGNAAVYNIGQEGNIYLGFYAANEVSTKSVLINIGTSEDCFNGFTLNLSTNTYVVSVFGNNWYNNFQVFWSLIGYDGNYGQSGSVYAGRPTSQPLLQTDVLGSTSLNEDQYFALSDKIGALFTTHTAGNSTLSYVTGSRGNSHQISVVDNSPTSFAGLAGNNYGTFTAAAWEQIIGGLSIQQFAFDGVNSFPTTFDGTYGEVMQSNGIISVVPEPSTYALIILGALSLYGAYRRKVA
jgi:hypothetical protein